MEKLHYYQEEIAPKACCCGAESGKKESGNAKGNKTAKPGLSPKKGWWTRYLARVKRHETDVRSCCK